ncbi:MAG: ribonuclease III [Actinobacteria bacterium]|nr:ribonuclease III [Actinomycetota bacterium]
MPTPRPDVGPGSGLGRLLAELSAERRRECLTHSSWSSPERPSYERLELLGDSVLQLVVTEALLRRFPDADEGQLAWMRQGIVARAACAEAARDGALVDALASAAPVGDGDIALLTASDRVAASLAEAVIGAAWLDLGWDLTRGAVLDAVHEPLSRATPGRRDPKTTLQERAARVGGVRYDTIATEGPAHRRTFSVAVFVGGAECGRGTGASKRAAETAAASAALSALDGTRPC